MLLEAASAGGGEAGDDDEASPAEVVPGAPPLVYNAWDDGKVMSEEEMNELPSWVWTTKKISYAQAGTRLQQGG